MMKQKSGGTSVFKMLGTEAFNTIYALLAVVAFYDCNDSCIQGEGEVKANKTMPHLPDLSTSSTS
jgi:hypothetical protein